VVEQALRIGLRSPAAGRAARFLAGRCDLRCVRKQLDEPQQLPVALQHLAPQIDLLLRGALACCDGLGCRS
jgi:hypothetical protein